MSFETPKDFQKYAQDCVKLAQQPNTPPELRQQLFQMAREWMQAIMAEEERSLLRSESRDHARLVGLAVGIAAAAPGLSPFQVKLRSLYGNFKMSCPGEIASKSAWNLPGAWWMAAPHPETGCLRALRRPVTHRREVK